MKTAEEWANSIDMGVWTVPDESLIKQIQLDAMKEGMRRAAEMVSDCMIDAHQSPEVNGYRISCELHTTAEQLTEKDL